MSVAFGSPLGGVLFGLEELDAFFDDGDVMWRGFVTSVIAAVSLQYIDPFGTSKLVLFQVTESRSVWRAFELVSNAHAFEREMIDSRAHRFLGCSSPLWG